MVKSGTLREAEYGRMTIPTWNRTTAEFVEPFETGELNGRLELRRHAARWLPDVYFAAYRKSGDLGRYAQAAADFFTAAFAESLWASLDRERDASQRGELATRFAQLLRQGVAAAPEQAACRWHVVALDIART
jgi:hypothetical protein